MWSTFITGQVFIAPLTDGGMRPTRETHETRDFYKGVIT